MVERPRKRTEVRQSQDEGASSRETITRPCGLSKKLSMGKDFKKKGDASFRKHPLLSLKLSDQGSNLDSPDPESDVLPVTPSDSCGCKSKIFFQKLSRLLRKNFFFI